MIEKLKSIMLVVTSLMAIAAIAVAVMLWKKPPVSTTYITPSATATAQSNTLIFNWQSYQGKKILYKEVRISPDSYLKFRQTIPPYMQHMISVVPIDTLFGTRFLLVTYGELEQ